MTILEKLFELQDKETVKIGDYDDFLKALPHDYYDEDMLHGAILTEIKDFRNDNKKVTAVTFLLFGYG